MKHPRVRTLHLIPLCWVDSFSVNCTAYHAGGQS